MKARRSSWKAEPLTIPQPIPAPSRVWTDDEMAVIRRGCVPHIMDEKWFIFIAKNRLFAHRSWTGLGVYEATFAPTEGGYVIESAIVTGNEPSAKAVKVSPSYGTSLISQLPTGNDRSIETAGQLVGLLDVRVRGRVLSPSAVEAGPPSL